MLIQTSIFSFGVRLLVFTSPMRRACETANAIAGALQCKAEVMPDIYEVGGIYRAQPVGKDGEGPKQFVKVPGKGLTAQEIERTFPNVSATRLPSEGQWDGGRGVRWCFFMLALPSPR